MDKKRNRIYTEIFGINRNSKNWRFGENFGKVWQEKEKTSRFRAFATQAKNEIQCSAEQTAHLLIWEAK